MNKRVLIIGYPFVDANMGGVRLRRIARALPQHGWDPVILTHPRDAASVPAEKSDPRTELVAAPDLAELYSRLRRARRPQKAAKPNEPLAKDIGLTSEINRWLMIPDKQVIWYRAAVRRGRELLRQEAIAAIFSTLDPRTSLLIAARLSKDSGVPCVLEYRDLWTGNPYYHLTQPTRLHRWLHRCLERKALKQARIVSVVSRGIKEHLVREHGDVLRTDISLNYNFFDPNEYPPTQEATAISGPFVVSYVGSLYASRTPRALFEGMRLFVDQHHLKPDQFRFRWAGGAAGITDLAATLDSTGIRPYLDFLGQIPHIEALRVLQRSHAAVLIQAPDDIVHIPGKLFEAFGARIPLLALSHPCETAELIQRCRAGVVCGHTPETVARGLAQLHSFVKSGKPWNFDESELRQFSAAVAIGKLAATLERACT